jgi:hypothetical protein
MKKINGSSNRIKFYFSQNPFSINAITKSVQTNKCGGERERVKKMSARKRTTQSTMEIERKMIFTISRIITRQQSGFFRKKKR